MTVGGQEEGLLRRHSSVWNFESYNFTDALAAKPVPLHPSFWPAARVSWLLHWPTSLCNLQIITLILINYIKPMCCWIHSAGGLSDDMRTLSPKAKTRAHTADPSSVSLGRCISCVYAWLIPNCDAKRTAKMRSYVYMLLGMKPMGTLTSKQHKDDAHRLRNYTSILVCCVLPTGIAARCTFTEWHAPKCTRERNVYVRRQIDDPIKVGLERYNSF